MRGGFTLLEALAAAVLLGSLATASMPLMLRAHRSREQARLVIDASHVLANLPEHALTAGALANHPGLLLRVQEAPPGSGNLPGSEPWFIARIVATGADGADRDLAVRLFRRPHGAPR